MIGVHEVREQMLGLQRHDWEHVVKSKDAPHPMVGKIIKFHAMWSREPAYGKCHGQVSDFQYLVSAVHGTVFPNDSEFRVVDYCDIKGIWSEEAFRRIHNG